MTVDNTFEQAENKRVARVALGFLSRFQEFSDNQATVSERFVTEHFSKPQLTRLVAIGALQERAEHIDGAQKRVFDVAKLETLAEQKLTDVRAAGRECA